MQATRQQILDHLREHGEGNVRTLGDVLELTATGVRQHLMILEREGFVASREMRGRVGRPALVYRLTERGEALYPKAYDRLAVAMIAAARDRLPVEAFSDLMRTAAGILAEEHAERVGRGAPFERLTSLCEVLREQDIVVDFERTAAGFVLEQRTCPFHDAAEASTATCDLDTAFIGALTQMDVALLTSRARGDDTCRFLVQPAGPAGPAPRVGHAPGETEAH
ncbi:MAG: hypothetical protein M0R73_11555 [Dehalococcoidia bacterium]|nr:hypothetical protein [Dehalococcoidia bacterium]